MGKQNRTTIRGIILAAGWERNGGISAIDIAGYDEKIYRVVDDKTGRLLRDHIKKRIIAAGIIMTHDNRPAIQVLDFQIDMSGPQSPGVEKSMSYG